jgi:hypothetical protein
MSNLGDQHRANAATIGYTASLKLIGGVIADRHLRELDNRRQKTLRAIARAAQHGAT